MLIEAILFAAVGVLSLLGAAGLLAYYRWQDRQTVAPPSTPDPYREALEAASRMSAKAWEAEQAMWHVAQQGQRGQR